MPKTEPAICWGLRVGGNRPYLSYNVAVHRTGIEALRCKSYHRAVRVAIVPLAEYRRLLRETSDAG